MLEIESLRQQAMLDTGLEDFGDPAFYEALERLLDALLTEARLNEFGQLRSEMTILAGLSKRLQVQDYLVAHPEIADDPVRQPVFIIGLPRTGTTALHHLLNQDPRNRTLRLWEAQNPIPPPQTATYTSDPRIAAQAQSVALTESFLPGFKRTHLIDAEEPDECYMLLNRNFMSVEYPALFHIPSFANWFYANLCRSDSYDYHRRQLQLLQSQHPGSWILKAPFHQLGLREILRVYPDAIILQTHRAPMAFVASGCSFSELLRRSGSDEIDRAQVGRDWMNMLTAYTRTFEADRAALEPSHPHQFIDLLHDDFLRDPWSVLEQLYALRGMSLDASARERMQAWLDAHPRGQHGEHRYRLQDYSIDRGEVEALFGDYVSRYGLNMDEERAA